MQATLYRKWFIALYSALFFCALAIAQDRTPKDYEYYYDRGISSVKSKNYDDAINFLRQAYTAANELTDTSQVDIGGIAYALSNAYFQKRKFKEALHYSGVSIQKSRSQKNDSLLIRGLNQSASIYQKLGNFDHTRVYLNEILGITVKNHGEDSDPYARVLSSLCSMHIEAGDYKKAIAFNKASTTILEKIYGPKSLELATNLNNLSLINTKLGNYHEAINILDRLLSSYSEADKINQKDNYGFTIYMKAFTLVESNENEMAIEIYKEAQKIFDDPDDPGNIAANGNIGLCYTELGDYENAMRYINRALAKTSKSNVISYNTRMQNLAYLYNKLGDYQKAEAIYKEARKIMVEAEKTGHIKYGQLLNNIGKMYLQKGALTKAQPLFKEALEIFLKTHDENHIRYGYQLNDYANTLLDMGRSDEALTLFHKNLNLLESNNKTDLIEYANRQFNLGSAYNQLHQFNDALPLMQRAVKQTKTILGEDDIKYGLMLYGLGQTYVGLNNKDNAINALARSNELFIKEIDKVFRFRSEKEKRDFMAVIKERFDEIQSTPFISDIESPKLSEINLNNQLLLKGLLLNNSKGMMSQLRSLNDDAVNSKIQEYNSLRTLLAKTLSLSFDERDFDLDSLKDVVNQKEVDLVMLHDDYFDMAKSLKRDWKASRNVLKADEAAIEFVNFDMVKFGKQTDSTIYCAYVYKKEWTSPKLIRIFNKDQLSTILEKRSPNQLYSSHELFNLIWKPLQKELKNTRTIYYAPSGLLNQISFGAIKHNEGILADTYNLVQLSSTAMLQHKLTTLKQEDILLVGGINYDYTETVTAELDSTAYVYMNMESIKGSRATRNRGESWKELPGSALEIEQLATLLANNINNIRLLKGKKATETQLKRLSGKSPNMLHIATHGFFYENMERKPFSSFSLNTEDRYRLADDPLLRSGLILAGANYAWKNGSNPMEEDDGILSALEISNLDYSNTDMVVLSACETGLGDIDGSEGVYGLQRAFKMAGVDIIVMSLWQVPDKETAEFMQIFYREWLTLDNARLAFNNAQKSMQEHYPDEPVKWAAFVLFE